MRQLIKTRNLEIAQTCQKNKFRTLLVLRPEIGKGIVGVWVCVCVCVQARVHDCAASASALHLPQEVEEWRVLQKL